MLLLCVDCVKMQKQERKKAACQILKFSLGDIRLLFSIAKCNKHAELLCLSPLSNLLSQDQGETVHVSFDKITHIAQTVVWTRSGTSENLWVVNLPQKLENMCSTSLHCHLYSEHLQKVLKWMGHLGGQKESFNIS